jgi:hypothetical protein
VDSLQKRVFGGCHLTRSITELLTAAGFTVTKLDTFYAPKTRHSPRRRPSAQLLHPDVVGR